MSYVTKARVLYGTLALIVILLLFPPHTRGGLSFVLDPPTYTVWEERGGPVGSVPVSRRANVDFARLLLLLAVVGVVGGALYWKAPEQSDG